MVGCCSGIMSQFFCELLLLRVSLFEQLILLSKRHGWVSAAARKAKHSVCHSKKSVHSLLLLPIISSSVKLCRSFLPCHFTDCLTGSATLLQWQRAVSVAFTDPPLWEFLTFRDPPSVDHLPNSLVIFVNECGYNICVFTMLYFALMVLSSLILSVKRWWKTKERRGDLICCQTCRYVYTGEFFSRLLASAVMHLSLSVSSVYTTLQGQIGSHGTCKLLFKQSLFWKLFFPHSFGCRTLSLASVFSLITFKSKSISYKWNIWAKQNNSSVI